MPGIMQSLDTGFPQFHEGQKTEQKIDAIMSYLFMLREQLSYTLNNLGGENFNEVELSKILEGLVTFKDLSGESATTIEGGSVKTATISAKGIGLEGKFSVYAAETAEKAQGGSIGYMSGSTGEAGTDGIGMESRDGKCYVIVTTDGVRLQAGDMNIYLAPNGRTVVNGDLVVRGNVEYTGELTKEGTT